MLKQSSTFKPPIFFHNKTIQSQARVKTLNCTYSRASLGVGSNPFSLFFPPGTSFPLLNSRWLCFLQRQDKRGFKIRKGLPPVLAESRPTLPLRRPFCMGISEASCRYYLLQISALGFLLSPCLLKTTRHSLVLWGPKAHTSGLLDL